MSGPIVAIGGAEFTMRPENEALHDYVVADRLGRPTPRICLLPTASGDPHDQIVAFHGAMERRGCEASAISLFRLGDAPDRLRRAPARAGRDLRHRRQHGQPAGALARAPDRRDHARGPRARDRPLRLQRRLDVLVRARRLPGRRSAGAAFAGLGLLAGQPLRPLLAGPRPPGRLPPRRRRRRRSPPGSRSTTTPPR